jgi:hypothetical protein
MVHVHVLYASKWFDGYAVDGVLVSHMKRATIDMLKSFTDAARGMWLG